MRRPEERGDIVDKRHPDARRKKATTADTRPRKLRLTAVLPHPW
jgi:hypothetical protein